MIVIMHQLGYASFSYAENIIYSSFAMSVTNEKMYCCTEESTVNVGEYVREKELKKWILVKILPTSG